MISGISAFAEKLRNWARALHMDRPRSLLALIPLLVALPAAAQDDSRYGLVGVARIPSNARDALGETLGGFGSGFALVPGSWHATKGGFAGRLAAVPDRGWNTEGTTDFRARLQYFDLALAPGHELALTYRRTQLLNDPAGQPTTGLDPAGVRPAKGGLPDLPLAGNGHVSLDSEAVALPGDGTIWISDEYGPYVYHFDAKGRMIGAIRPPEAFIPARGGKESFSANSPPHGEKRDMGNPQRGRQDNQGFEGMSLTPDHRHLFVITQSALIQDLDPAAVKTTRRHVRLLDYDLGGKTPRLAHEYVVALPLWSDGKTSDLVAAQSEMLALDGHRLLLLCRDSGGGFTGKRDASAFRRVMMIDLAGATDIKGRYDGAGDAVSPLGVLRAGIVPAGLSPVLDINDNTQLGRFGLHNGTPNDRNDLYEKWEGMALAPDTGAPGDYFLFVGSDNDFITQDGVMAGKPYADSSGANVDSLVLVYRIRLPRGS